MSNPQANWDQYWANSEEHAWWKKPAPEVLEFIGSQSPQSRPEVLDLGVDWGDTLSLLRRRGSGSRPQMPARRAFSICKNGPAD